MAKRVNWEKAWTTYRNRRPFTRTRVPWGYFDDVLWAQCVRAAVFHA